MKANQILCAILGPTLLMAFQSAHADGKSYISPQLEQRQRGGETSLDLPTDPGRYFGQRVYQQTDREMRIAKIDLDADFNLDGVISDTDPSDGGLFENTPPGLVVGVGEFSKVILRLYPYRLDFDGDMVVSLEFNGINRADASGRFASEAELAASVGHIRVWDISRTQLYLDSRDPNRRYVEWTWDKSVYPANHPNMIPRAFYVEGVSPSGRYMGDVQLVATVFHRRAGAQPDASGRSPVSGLTAFRSAFDSNLLTILEQPAPKSFINNNAEAAWISPQPSGSK